MPFSVTPVADRNHLFTSKSLPQEDDKSEPETVVVNQSPAFTISIALPRAFPVTYSCCDSDPDQDRQGSYKFPPQCGLASPPPHDPLVLQP